MKLRVNILLLVVWMLVTGAAHTAETLLTVATVIDGDTIVLTNKETVRYAGIDTPEFDHEHRLAQPLAQAAKDFNNQLVAGKQVRLEMDREDHDGYGRRIAYVFLDNGTMANQALVERGLAVCAFHPPNLKYFQQLLDAQREAMTARRRLWESLAAGEIQTLIGNRRSLRFHRTQCPLGQQTAATNRIVFSSRWEAFWNGFAPCKRCLDAAYRPLPAD